MALKCTRKQNSRKGRKNKHTDYQIYRWWNRNKTPNGKKTPRKWKSLQHNGPLFSPDYKPLPKKVKFYYNGKPMTLKKEAEEAAGLYSKYWRINTQKRRNSTKTFFGTGEKL